MKAIFAAGCFWGVESYFQKLHGVQETRVGYIGGHLPAPTYKEVCQDNTGHAEAIEITFNPDLISYIELLQHFFKMHDPTQFNRQGPDVGTQYRSAIFYMDEQQKKDASDTIAALQSHFTKPIVTTLEPATQFHEAEEYHQKYHDKNGGSCHL